MVVVLVVIARTPTAAEAAAAWGEKGREANMCEIIKDAGLALAYSALTTASPICAVPTLVVPSL
jgi:hypothetical protein